MREKCLKAKSKSEFLICILFMILSVTSIVGLVYLSILNLMWLGLTITGVAFYSVIFLRTLIVTIGCKKRRLYE